MSVNGILCVDKPPEMTSFSCCGAVRRITGAKRAGHAGTLDPMATGVLPVLLGAATRALDYLPDHTKRYRAALRFGAVSDTLDVWGKVTETGRPLPCHEAVEAALASFRGDILQVPPMTSALKKDGVRLYELARRGQTVEREPRPVTVYDLTLLAYNGKDGIALLDCTCSRGTYIRSICHDLGAALGCGAVMTGLRRTAALGFTEETALTLEEIRVLGEEGTLSRRVIPLFDALAAYPVLTVTGPQGVRFQNGGALALDRLSAPVEGLCRVCDPKGVFLGLGRPAGAELAVARLFPGSEPTV